MPTLTLIRHAMPRIDPDRDPSTWELTDTARATAAAIPLPPGPHHFVASGETKATDTLRQLTHGPIATHPGLREVTRPQAPDGHTHRTLAAAYLNGTTNPGWEPPAAVAARFTEAITTHLAIADGAHLIAATHGMAMTVWLTTVTTLPDPVAYWRALTFPDAITVALPEHWPHPRPATT